MTTPEVFQRELAGEVISLNDPDYPKIAALITEAQRDPARVIKHIDPATSNARYFGSYRRIGPPALNRCLK